MVGLLGCGCCGATPPPTGCLCDPAYNGEFSFTFDEFPPELVTISGTDANLRVVDGKLVNTLAKYTTTRVGVRSSYQLLNFGSSSCYSQYDLTIDFELLPASWVPVGLGQHSIEIGLWDTLNQQGTAYLGVDHYQSGILIRWYAPGLTASPTLPRYYSHNKLFGNLRIRATQEVPFASYTWAAFVDGVQLPHTSSSAMFGCDFYSWIFHRNDIVFPVQQSTVKLDNFTQAFTEK
jgi:hypothetical protein